MFKKSHKHKFLFIFFRSFTGVRIIEVQNGEGRADESETRADGEERAEHPKRNITGQQRDASAEESIAVGRSLQSFKRQT